MLMMAPEPWRSITGSACLQPRKTLFRLKSTCASQTSSDIPTGPPGAEPATLFTRMSRRPKCRTQVSIISFTALLSVTSQRWVSISLFDFSIVSKRDFLLRSTAKIFAPSSAKRAAMARPLPQPGPTEPAPVTMAILPLSLEPIEPRRVVDEKRLALLLRGRDLGQVIDHHAVVRNLLQVGVRPVSAPDRLLGKLCHQLARERDRVLPRRGLPRDALAAAHLDPDVLVLQQIHQVKEVLLVHSQRGIEPRHVVDDDRHRRALERRCELSDTRAFHVYLQR